MARRATLRCLTGFAILCVIGCSSVHMKATPFYTGEYAKTEGPAEKRVNLWPVLYHRKPALSVLWPLIEVTDEHVAANPLISVYKLDKERNQWRVLWPVTQFDFETGSHWIFPVFWWDDGFTVFPVVWYEPDWYFHLFPLWLHFGDAGDHDTWVFPPIFRLLRESDRQGFHVWPLGGSTEDENSGSYRFALWPLYQAWQDGEDSLVLTPIWSERIEGDARWRTLFPLYYVSENPSREEERLITPLFGRVQRGEKTRWILVPLASSAAWCEDEKDIWALAPLTHFRWGKYNVRNHVVPLYYYDRNDKLFLTPVFSRRNGEEDGFVNFFTILAHYTYQSDGEKTFRLFPPLTYASWGGEGKENSFFPLWNYERYEDLEEDRLHKDFSLLWYLYDYRLRRSLPTQEDPERPEEYVRSRLLWRLLHYERVDADKTLDVFPGITWDRKADGYRQFSFMWRLFRIERTEDGGRNLDFLFIPLMRENGAVEGG